MTSHKKTFHLQEGKTFSDVKGLAKNLKNMSEEAFNHHVNKTKNDFANWLRHSLKQEELAERIESKLDKIEVELEVLRHLVHDQNKKKTAPTTKKAVKKEAPKKKTTKKVAKKK